MTKPRHEIIQEVIKMAGSSFVSVDFLKVDGTRRQVRFNPRDFNEIKGTGKPCNNPNVFRIREVHNKDEGKTTWRSFDARRVLRIQSRGQAINFNDIEQ